jgi:signal transduction histidine kinase
MKKKSGYYWVLFSILLVLIIDAYYQITSSETPIWQTDWFIKRAIAVILAIIALIIYYYIEFKKKTRTEFEKFKEKLIQQQENQWKLIAAELHDNIGQNLSAVNIFLQQEINTNPAASHKIQQASELIIDTINEVRNLSQQLYPKQIERLGLTIAIESLIDKTESLSNIKFNINIENIDSILKPEIEVQFYRTIQEILNNIIKHSKATEAVIKIKKSLMFITAEISDNGIGFDRISSSKLGFGLLNIEERLKIIKAAVEFRSAKNEGTHFKITIPIKQNS